MHFNDHKPILVIGATGGIGRAVITELPGPGVSVRAIARDVGNASLPPSVDIFPGDLTQPETLADALSGVGAVFLLWTAPASTVAAVVDLIAAHAERVVFLSSPHKTPHPFFQQSPDNPMRKLHEHIEDCIARSTLESTVLRPGMFASNALNWWGPAIRSGDTVRWPYGDAETAPIDERDVAAVAARVLTDEKHSGGDYVLTGPQSLSQREQVRIIGDVTGRRIQFDELSPGEFRRETAGTWPAPVVEMLLDAWRAAVGHPAFVTNTVFEITGSPARTFREWAEDTMTRRTS